MFNNHLKWISLVKFFFLAVILGLLTGSGILTIVPAKAQSFGDWSPPYRLSTDKAVANEASLVTDRYGYVHVFWKEVQENTRSTIQYARFDGSIWTIPNDIHATKPADIIDTIILATIDEDNLIHLIWIEGYEAKLMYSYVHALDADNAKNWAIPRRLELPTMGTAYLKIDSKGIFHLLFAIEFGEGAGLYHTRSKDRGQLWSTPLRIDPDTPPNNIPADIQFVLDENDVLHAAWYYFSLDFTGGDWVRYSRSVNGGESWSTPFTIDKEEISGPAGQEKDLSNAAPRMVTSGETVHIIWASGDQSFFRYHRYSSNSGETWSRPARVFGGLNGQAGDGFTVDGAGRVHFFSQIRFPRGIWHMIWDRGEWSMPSLVYLISVSPEDPIGSRIHAHRTYPIVRAGNQLVLTFTDPPGTPNRRLFTMHSTLADIEAQQVEPTPIPIPTDAPEIEDEQVSGPDPDEVNNQLQPVNIEAPTAIPSSVSSIWIGSTISLFALVGFAVYQAVKKQRH